MTEIERAMRAGILVVAVRRKHARNCPCRTGDECGTVAEKMEGKMNQSSGQQVQVQIKADEKELIGQYCNLVMIHHNAEEFTLHFIYVFPNTPQGKLVSSSIVSPAHAKRIWRALGENINRYETQFGPIREVPQPNPTPTVGFVQ
jgi:Protein of unknown function (DUF3467)